MALPTMLLLPDVEAALVALLQANLPDSVDVQVITGKDFNNDGDLVMPLPAVRVLFDQGQAASVAGAYNATYEVPRQFQVWCADENLSSDAAQQTASAVLLGQVLEAIVGQTLQLPHGATTEPILWRGEGRFEDDQAGHVLIAFIEVSGFAQFIGGGN